MTTRWQVAASNTVEHACRTRWRTQLARGAGAVIAVTSLLAAVGTSATAGPPGQWTQITRAHNGAASNLGLARGKDGKLHVLWAGPTRRPYTAVYDTPISPAGVAGPKQPVVSGWVRLNPPAAVALPDGSVHALISGQKTNSTTDPNAGINEVVGPGGWQLGARAFGSAPITDPSNADVRTAVLKSGQLVTVWKSAASMLFQSGVEPSTQPDDISVPKDAGVNVVIAVDAANGSAVIAYKGVTTGNSFFRRILPALAAPSVTPGSKVEGPSIASRAGGGVYAAYVVGGAVRLLRFGGKAIPVPVPKGARALTAGLAAGPDGRLWVFYGDERSTYVTRTSKAVGGFEPVQALKSPPGTVQYFRLEGEGSAGPLDLFADVTIDGQTKDGSYHTQVWPALSLRVTAKQSATGTRVTVRVTDAGDGVKGAKVTGLPGGSKTTGATGSIVYVAKAGTNGRLALMATKPGYVSAKGTVSL